MRDLCSNFIEYSNLQILKFIGASVFALFALITAFKTLRFVLMLLTGSGNAMTFSGLPGGFAGVILSVLLAYWCWKSATRLRQADDRLNPPLPEVPQHKR